ncbi:MAG: CPBP family intramembrane glutamic endopeptidase, partial [Dehalococcoidia bacterium]
LWGYDLNLVAVVSISTLVLVLDRYHPIGVIFPLSSVIYYLFIPLAAGSVIFRDKPWDYGIRAGLWKLGLIAIAVGLPTMALVLYGAGKMAEFQSYYHRDAIDWPELLLAIGLHMFAWEFLFRGYMLFGLEKSIGKNAIFVQAIPFVLLHLGKPFLETLACIPGGFIFGYVAYRTRSFLPCFVIHFGMYMMMAFFTSS